MLRPSRSFSSPPGCEVLAGAAVELPAAASGSASASKSMRDSSPAAEVDAPPSGNGAPCAIFAAPSTSPFFSSLYLSAVRCMLSLMLSNLATASWSSDSSSHIFWILGCALCSAAASSSSTSLSAAPNDSRRSSKRRALAWILATSSAALAR